MSPPVDISLMIIGNPGVGKSFLCNILLSKDRFAHKWSPQACTANYEVDSFIFPLHGEDTRVHCHNVPGLIDPDDQSKTEENKRFIKQAFQAPGVHIVAYVFGETGGGRLQAQDFAAYHALKDAYNLQTTSVIIIKNLSNARKRNPQFDEQLLMQVQNGLKWPREAAFNYLVLNEIQAEGENFFDSFEAGAIRLQLLAAMQRSSAARYQIVKEIILSEDRIKQQQADMMKMEENMRKKGKEFEEYARNSKAAIEQHRQQQAEMEKQLQKYREAANKSKAKGAFGAICLGLLLASAGASA